MLKALGMVSVIALIGCTDTDANRSVDRAENVRATDARTADTGSMNANRQTEEFVRKAALGNLAEIQTSEIAETRAINPEVKEFARMMVKDHTASLEKLRAASSAYQLPTAADQSLQEDVNALRNADADSFDRKYLDMQEKMHERAVELFETYAEDGADPSLDLYAQSTLPTIRKHLAEVRRIRTESARGATLMGIESMEPRGVEPRSDAAETDVTQGGAIIMPPPGTEPVNPDPSENNPNEPVTVPLPTTDPDSVPERQPN